MIFVRCNTFQIEEGWENCTAVTWYGPKASLPLRGLALLSLNHVAILLLISVRVRRVMHKTNEHLAWVTCIEASPTETDLITKH